MLRALISRTIFDLEMSITNPPPPPGQDGITHGNAEPNHDSQRARHDPEADSAADIKAPSETRPSFSGLAPVHIGGPRPPPDHMPPSQER